MLVEVRSKVQAQRLQNSGHTRTGEKAVEAPLEALDEMIENDDVSVKKVSLHRNNSDEEARVIDDLINQGYEGKVEQTYNLKSGYGTTGKDQTRRVFNLDDSSVTIYRDYQDVVAGDVDDVTVDPERFDEVRQQVIENVDEEIAELREKIEKKEEERNELEALEYEEWVENGAKRLN